MGGYWIKGIDGRPYHASDTQTVLQWIEENRIAPFTEIRAENSDEFKKAETYPEFSQAFHSPPRVASQETSPPLNEVQAQSSLQVGLALKEGWQFFRENVFLSYSAFLIWILIIVSIFFCGEFFQFFLTAILGDYTILRVGSQLFGFLVQMIVTGPLMVGFYKFWLNMVDKENPQFSDFLNGFAIWWPAMLAQWLKTLITVALIVLSFPFFSLSLFSKFENFLQSGQIPALEEWGVFLLALFLLATIIVILMTFFWYVEFFLADRCSLKVMQCFKASFRLVFNNLGAIISLFTLLTLILIGGAFLVVGIFLVLPWTFLVLTHAYRQLVPRGTKL